jgi:hypothetical protein
MNLLCYFQAQLRDVLLHCVHERLDIPLHLLGREPQLSYGHPDHAHSFSVLACPHHVPHTSAHICDNSARLCARHQALGTQLPAQCSFVELLQAVNMAQASVELDDALLDMRENVVFANKHRPFGSCLGRGFGVWGRDDADAYVRFDGMRQSQAVSNSGSVFERA